MFLFETRVGESAIAGTGVFAGENITCGAHVGDLTEGVIYLTEDEYQQAAAAANFVVIQSAVRLVGSIFVCSAFYGHDADYDSPAEDYINHSNDPNLLYHCGVLFARRDIKVGDELTVNYKYLLAENDVCSFVDIETGKRVCGLSGAAALAESTRELAQLLPYFSQPKIRSRESVSA